MSVGAFRATDSWECARITRSLLAAAPTWTFKGLDGPPISVGPLPRFDIPRDRHNEAATFSSMSLRLAGCTAIIAERRYEHERLDLLAGNLDQPLTEVDLQLMTGRRLEPHRRQSLGPEGLAIGLNRPLDRPETDGDTLFGQQVLTHHVGVAALADEPLAQPCFVPVERLRPLRRLEWQRSAHVYAGREQKMGTAKKSSCRRQAALPVSPATSFQMRQRQRLWPTMR